MSLLLLQSLVYIEFFLQGEWRPMLVIFTVQLLTLVPLILSYFNKSNIAKWYFNLVYPFFMAGLIMTHGAELSDELKQLFQEVQHTVDTELTRVRLVAATDEYSSSPSSSSEQDETDSGSSSEGSS